MEVGVVQCVNVSAQALPERMGQFLLVVDGGNRFKMRFKGSEATGLDSGLVHVGVVEICDLTRAGASRCATLGGFFNQASGALVAEFGQGRENTDAAAVRRDFGTLDPVAIGVLVEVVTGLDRPVHVGDSNAVSRLRRFLGTDEDPREDTKRQNGGPRPRKAPRLPD